MRFFKNTIPIFILFAFIQSLAASDSIHYEFWDINNLDSIGGHQVEVLGDPQVENTAIGNAVRFDGVEDQLIVDFNPIGDAKEFTVELVFNPDACFPNNVDPRFLHMQDPNDPDDKRVLIELRVNENNQCYIDGFMKTDSESLPLIDATMVHPTEVWQHAAITYKDSILTTYFNGVIELSGKVGYTNKIINTVGKTSLGARMDVRKYYAGMIKYVKVSHAVLDPQDFIFIHDNPGSTDNRPTPSNENTTLGIYPNPVDKVLVLNTEDLPKNSSVELSVFDSSGKEFYREVSKYNANDMIRLNTSGFQTGIYLLSLKSDLGIETGKFIILH